MSLFLCVYTGKYYGGVNDYGSTSGFSMLNLYWYRGYKEMTLPFIQTPLMSLPCEARQTVVSHLIPYGFYRVRCILPGIECSTVTSSTVLKHLHVQPATELCAIINS